MGALLSSTAIGRVIANRKSEISSLGADISSGKNGLPALMDDGSAYERAFNQIAAKEMGGC